MREEFVIDVDQGESTVRISHSPTMARLASPGQQSAAQRRHGGSHSGSGGAGAAGTLKAPTGGRP